MLCVIESLIPVYIYQFPYWKMPIVRQCFPESRLIFVDKVSAIVKDVYLVLWGMTPIPSGLPENVLILRIEDGFIRSVGLGADFIKPLSWVIDAQGIYYDATRTSDLESLCMDTVFDDALLKRAAALRLKIVATNVTKYNVGTKYWQRPNDVVHVILVPGQVESDASLVYGAPLERTNMGLLRAVRFANPEAYIIYKPHPDVLARLRLAGLNEDSANLWCDEIVTDVAMGDLLTKVDEVHVLTSLAGFEGLLRQKPVTCYGQPFYSGWGLTRDIILSTRRSRRLSLDELVAATLIKYPLYLSRDSKDLITPEQALDEMLVWQRTVKAGTPWWREVLRFFIRHFGRIK